MTGIVEIINAYPTISIVIISIGLSFFISLVNYFVLDKDRMRQIKADQKKMQQEISKHQKEGNTAKAMQLQKEMFAQSGEMLKHSFKPMIITAIPIIIVFALIKNVYAQTTIAKTWFWYYLVSAILSSIVFRKLFKLP